MNRTLHPRRTRVPSKRTAAATAAVVGAALLAYAGAAAAQTGVDCAALGDDPMQGTLKTALVAADECGVEVRIENRTWPYSTVYATPEGALHLVSTADPLQQWENDGRYDPTLEEWEGSLTQKHTNWVFLLQHTDAEVPLLESNGATTLDWTGATPVPAYTGTTAVYDELAAGLDLTVDVGVDAADLRFEAADADAWNALASGLSIGESPLVSAEGGSLYFSATKPFIITGSQRTTPFTVRDAQGTVTRAELAVGEGGALTIALPDGAIEDAAFPLTLATQWTHGARSINEWGATTSAAPDLALFRGRGGLAEPYFTAAGETGDAVVGAYCDATFTAACDDAEAAAYWNFQWPLLDRLRTVDGFILGFPVESATFSVDAADPSACVAPDVQLTDPYVPVTTWAASPGTDDLTAAGACENGTAAYDVANLVSSVWLQGSGDRDPVTLAITASAETARFHGGSARLDVYFDVRGYMFSAPTPSPCGPSAPDYTADTTPGYGGFYFSTWLPQVTDTEITWTAKFSDVADGRRTVLTTGPHTAVEGWNTKVSVPDASPLPDGRYEILYDIYVDDRWARNVTCGLIVDTEDPEVLDIEVAPGPHHIGDTTTIDLTLADEYFPDGWNTLTVGCVGGSQCENPQQVEVSDDGTVRFEVRLPKAVNKPRFYISDSAGNEIYSDTVVIPATNALNDYDQDGRQDLLTVRKSDGSLMLHAGRGDGTFKTAVAIGTGWGKMDIAMVGDVTGDGFPDLFARNTITGTAYTYQGNGAGGVGSRVVAGTGWQDIGAFGAGGEVFETEGLDILAVDRSDGNLYYYPFAGDGSGAFASRILVGTGWNGMDNVTGYGDVDNDGFGDLLARDSRTGTYYVYYYREPYGPIEYGRRTALGAALGESTRRYEQIVNAGDLGGDGYNDLLGTDTRTGELVSLSYGEKAALVRPAEVVATGWGGSRLPAGGHDRTYDYNGDGKSDVLVRRASDGNLSLYPGNGSAGFGPIGSWGTELQNLTLIETAGDFNGDGFSDVIGRVGTTGELYLYPGNGQGNYDHSARVRIGTGWNSMSAIATGHDYNGDGRPDLIAREQSTGYLWLYPGNGAGGLGTRTKAGSGWNSMRDITAAGDLDHDGLVDVLAVRDSDNCMYFYGGNGNGTLKTGVQVGCGWAAMDNIAAVGDFNGDGHADWIARRKSDGGIYLYKGDGMGDSSGSVVLSTGWTWANAIV
jgi:hypothetical protein